MVMLIMVFGINHFFILEYNVNIIEYIRVKIRR